MPSRMLRLPAIQKFPAIAFMEEKYIQSRQNEQVKNLVKLRERKHRDRQGRFLVEGLREISHAIAAGFEMTHLYFCPEFFPGNAHTKFMKEIGKSETLPFIRMSEDAFTKASHREGPDGLIAIGIQQSNSLGDLALEKAPLLLVIEGIEKPGNLGAILRSADGAGVDAVILVDCVLDLYNPNAIRSSQGLVFALPVVAADRLTLSEWLGKHGIQCCATTPDTDQFHWDINYRAGTALLMGSERDGLSEFWLDRAEQKVRIPMKGQADSLNVAAAAAVCLYEARRQRDQLPS